MTVSHRVGVSYTYLITQRQNFSARLDYTRNDYKQDPLYADTTGMGVVDGYVCYAGWTYQLFKHWSMTLEYQFLLRDAESDDDDRQQNQVLLKITGEHPFMW